MSSSLKSLEGKEKEKNKHKVSQ